jgi:hypothetical protein
MLFIIVINTSDKKVMRERIRGGVAEFLKESPIFESPFGLNREIVRFLALPAIYHDDISSEIDKKYLVPMNSELDKLAEEIEFITSNIPFKPDLIICTSRNCLKSTVIISNLILKDYKLSFVYPEGEEIGDAKEDNRRIINYCNKYYINSLL